MGEIALIKTARRPHFSDQPETRTSIEKLLADARLKLVETGTRNRLVHSPQGARRTRSLQILGAVPDFLFTALVRDGKPLRFLAAADAMVDAQREAARLKVPRLVTARFGRDGRDGLQTALTPEFLHRRLHAMQRDAKTAEEERGVNILFLALGFLRWYEDDRSDVIRQAPLILVPVALARDSRRSIFEVKFRDEDIMTNQALQERLRTDFAIAFPAVPDNEDWLPSHYFEMVANAVKTKRRWSIDTEAIELGFYSFSKLLMVRDLEPANWPNDALVQHPLVRGLLCDGFASEPPIFTETTALDEVLDPGDLMQVVDADSSQTKVIETVRAGRNLIVQGPPGTGKSQTITNIIASAVHDGKSVLFVAEKMAALKVVHNRLRKAGLDELCLELHSNTVNTRLVASRLDQTLHATPMPPSAAASAQSLTAARDRLNLVARRLHTEIGDTGMTPFRALSIQIALANQRQNAPDARLVEEASRWTRKQFERNLRLTKRLADLTASAGPLRKHIYFGVRRMNFEPTDFQRLLPRFKDLGARAAALGASAKVIMNDIGLKQEPTLLGLRTAIGILRAMSKLPRESESIATSIATAGCIRRIADAAALGAKWQAHRSSHSRIFEPAAWSAKAMPLRAPLAKASTSRIACLGKAYREASRALAKLLAVPLPPSAHERLQLVDMLLADEALRVGFAGEAAFLAEILGDDWHGARTDFAAVEFVARVLQSLMDFDPSLRLGRIVELLREGTLAPQREHLETRLFEVVVAIGNAVHALDLDVHAAFHVDSVQALDLTAIGERAAAWATHPGRFDEWTRLTKADQELRAEGPLAVAEGLASGALCPSRAVGEVQAAFAEASWRKAIALDPDLAAFDGLHHGELIAHFAELEVERRQAMVRELRARHQAELPAGALGTMGVIRGEIGRKRSHMPLRKLMAVAGDTIQKIKPVFLMSPISVAQFLPPGAVGFDLLVIDEASQVRPAEALGLIARCRQIVVVGDKKQLPPTDFFDRMIADEAEPHDEDETSATAPVAPVSDLESILSLCEARGLESRMLRWHYRSRHPSLIAVSNAEFYHRLIIPPSPTLERKDMGLVLRRVQGAYDRGGQRINIIEARAIAEAAARHARLCPHLSLGIVAFSTVQRDLIADLLEARRREDPALDSFLREGKDEDFFVKNLENVQGDERDVILISIGYGPREPGKPLDSMAFGPISAEGGERRLNVLFTRARLRCEIFVSFGSSNINLDRATGKGPRVLKRFLQFAETGILDEAHPTGADFDSPFEEAVAEAIKNLGYLVDKQVGSAGFKIDLAVRDPALPGRYILAIECDGATYHSALWARERDRLRQEALERLGWRFHRVWSTDWFYRRAVQLERLKEVLDDARQHAREKMAPPPISSSDMPSEAHPPRPGATRLPAYELARCDVPFGVEIHEVEPARLAAILECVIEQEGPIHRDEMIRRIASLFGKQKAGARILAAVARGLGHLDRHAPLILNDREFWFTQAQEAAPPARDRSLAPASVKKCEMIAPLEVEAAIAIARHDEEDLDGREAAAAVANLLGLDKTTPRFRALVCQLAEKSGAIGYRDPLYASLKSAGSNSR